MTAPPSLPPRHAHCIVCGEDFVTMGGATCGRCKAIERKYKAAEVIRLRAAAKGQIK